MTRRPDRVRRPKAPAMAPPARTAPLVLIVDDYPDNREMYSSFLSFSGLQVEEAANGREALAKAFALLPDLVVMDLSLPGVDGWQATRELKADPRTKHIPVVALTGHALAGTSDTALAAGCDLFLTKPCLPQDLLEEIRRVLAGEPAGSTPPQPRR